MKPDGWNIGGVTLKQVSRQIITQKDRLIDTLNTASYEAGWAEYWMYYFTATGIKIIIQKHKLVKSFKVRNQ